jgi:hypothetical protein
VRGFLGGGNAETRGEVFVRYKVRGEGVCEVQGQGRGGL